MHLQRNHVNFKPYTGFHALFFAIFFPDQLSGNFIMHLHPSHVRFKPYTGLHFLFLQFFSRSNFPDALLCIYIQTMCVSKPYTGFSFAIFFGLIFRELYYASALKPCAFQTLYHTSCSVFCNLFSNHPPASFIMHLHPNHVHFNPTPDLMLRFFYIFQEKLTGSCIMHLHPNHVRFNPIPDFIYFVAILFPD